jgi:hypothetical protein
MNAPWFDPAGTRAEFLPHEFLVVEIIIGDAEVVGVGRVRPAGLFIRTAFRAGLGPARHYHATIGANLRGHLRFTICNLRAHSLFLTVGKLATRKS